jgi:uncharacterized protein DUF5343
MPVKLPYATQPGSIAKVFEKVRLAQTPERFTGDFLETKLGFKGGNYRQFIPFAKKLGFLGSDGRPTDIYRSFRNTTLAKSAMAQAIKIGYSELFERNEKAATLARDEVKGMVVEITGLDSDSRVVQLIVQTFEMLRRMADFSASVPLGKDKPGDEDPSETTQSEERADTDTGLDLNLSYTINLVLPKSDDPAVFNAIFRSLREHLLRK